MHMDDERADQKNLYAKHQVTIYKNQNHFTGIDHVSMQMLPLLLFVGSYKRS
jgi:hypothetical protein